MRLRKLFSADLRFMARYGFFFLYAVLTAVYIVVLSVIPAHWRKTAAVILIFSDPAAMGLFFMGAIILLDLYGSGVRACAVGGGSLRPDGVCRASYGLFRAKLTEHVGQNRRCEAVRAVRVSFFQMIASMRRDPVLAAVCLAPVLTGLFFRYGIPRIEVFLTAQTGRAAVIRPYYGLIDLIFAMLSPVLFCFIPAMVALDEADEKTAAGLFVTPLGKTGYLSARLGIPAAASCLITVILLPVFGLTALTPAAAVLFAAGGTLQGIIVALLILALSSNRLEGMTVAKLSSLLLCGAAVPFFIGDDMQYALFFLPSFWIGKAACEDTLACMLPAAALSALWILPLFRRYLRRI